QAEHGDCRTADGVHLPVDGDGANGSPGEDDDHNGCVDDVRPPAQAMVAEHGSEDQLYIEHKNRQQGQSEKSGAALVEFGARLVCDTAACALETGAGRKNKTVSPPRMPCTMTVASAARPRRRSQWRFSAIQVQTAKMMVSSPVNSA